MNGVHDMGGFQDMGPVHAEKNEPVFHAPWEGRLYGIDQALRVIGKWNTDVHRYRINQLPPADYFGMSYYQHWLRINEQLLVEHGLVTLAELESGKADPGAPKATPMLTAAAAAARFSRGIASPVDPKVLPLFKVGQAVRARNLNPEGHCQLPRYVRGKSGAIARDHGVYNFPDTSALYLGNKRQHVYSVRFTARELWGDNASSRDTVHLDIWDDYLEPA